MVLCAAHVRMEKDFDRWNEIKKATDAADEAARLYFREGEVRWVRLGHNIGSEANGKSRLSSNGDGRDNQSGRFLGG